MSKLIGYDVSNHQAGLKLSTLQSDCFIFKATEGTFFVDKTCDSFVQQAKALNKPYGVYHFLDGSDVIAQADFFVKNIKGYVGEAVLILDYEMYGRQGAAQAKRFCDRVFDKTGVRCWLYMNESDCNSDNWKALANDYAFWIAKYSSNAPSVHDYLNVIGWQFTSTPLDKNEFYMDTGTWNKYASNGTKKPVKRETPQGPWMSENKRVTVNVDKNANIYSGFDWKFRQKASDLGRRQLNVTGKYEHENGQTYYSLYNDKGQWEGYINSGYAKEVPKNHLNDYTNPEGKWFKENKRVMINDPEANIYSGFDWKTWYKGKDACGEQFKVKGKYDHMNGYTYYSLYDDKDKWRGYINSGYTSELK
ncbi:GH25 family lysozyme [Vagococcus vulneris]|uniref:Lysozyme n=1 Tax=Vagococcus vulneris TaxID=1977869 RepID=A0A429ZR70_9ENTE|nr:GH25 family lysozyme [Vagococcus vulneris]RST96148.1 hypothetical protein CBF37_11210 [Vagococcus vulneris]